MKFMFKLRPAMNVAFVIMLMAMLYITGFRFPRQVSSIGLFVLVMVFFFQYALYHTAEKAYREGYLAPHPKLPPQFRKKETAAHH